MIKFFRKIRYDLLEKNKTGKYLKYAIGEIMLVVIGILIALQINNWNESSKDRLFEVKMLKEIKEALDNDIKSFSSLIRRMQRLDSTTIFFASKIHERSVYKDSIVEIDYTKINELYSGIPYNYNRGPYDALRSSGIDKVSNDSLRIELIRLYDFDFPRNMEITKWFDRNYEKQTDKIKTLFGNAEIVLENGEIKFNRNFKKEPLDQGFINLLEEINDRAKRVEGSLSYMVPKMINLRNHIIREIKTK